jgi:tRNA (guanine10-N2)-methyltransferase
MPEYLVRLAQVHESFRKAELEALAELTGIKMEIILYSEDVRLDF